MLATNSPAFNLRYPSIEQHPVVIIHEFKVHCSFLISTKTEKVTTIMPFPPLQLILSNIILNAITSLLACYGTYLRDYTSNLVGVSTPPLLTTCEILSPITFLKIPIAPFRSAFRTLPVLLRNRPRCMRLPKYVSW